MSATGVIEPAGIERDQLSLARALARLDRLLERAVAAAQDVYGPDAARDAFRGLHIGPDEVGRLLARAPGEPLFLADGDHDTGAHAAESALGVVYGTSDDGVAEARRRGRHSLFGHWGQDRNGATEEIVAAAAPTAAGAAPPANGHAPAAPSGDGWTASADMAGDHPLLVSLAQAFGLSRFDLNLIVIALAPELDLRYERLYAYLQDDVTRRRPSVDLALNLLCPSAEAKWAGRAHVGLDAPLIRHGLVSLVPDPSQVQPPLLGQYLKLDDRIVDHLLGRDPIDARLMRSVRLVHPEVPWAGLGLEDETRQRLVELLAWHHDHTAGDGPSSLIVHFHGPDGAGKRAVAEALCAELGTWLLVVSVRELLQTDLAPEVLMRLVFREAVLLQSPLYWDGFDLLLADDDRARGCREALVGRLEEVSGLSFLAGRTPWQPAGALHDRAFVSVALPTPPYAMRIALWQAQLDGQPTSDLDIHTLANQFRFGPGQIRDALATAYNRALWRDPRNGRITMDDLLAACQLHSHHKLGGLAQHIRPVYTWDDIVLPADQIAQLREVCHTVRYRPMVYGEWGFERKLSRGKGINALFAGPSGTGKTMASEIIASELGLELYKIDLSAVVSKYIGETEKNLEGIFREAQTSNAILFFDEADALFGKRSEVKDAHDRYANIEIAYLLQRMEEYDGITILATNLKSNLDDAFVRRMQFIVDFPFPEEADRLAIWRRIWPAETPLAADLDLPFMARQFRITGGNIKNVALAGAFLAAANGGPVGMTHLIQSMRREYQKMGKLCSEAEFGPYHGLVKGSGG